MDDFKNYREESRKHGWGQDGKMCIDQLKLGCMLRMADASEVMAKNNQQLINDKEKYKRWYKEEQAKNERHGKTIAGLRGYITRLKKEAT